MRHISLRYLTFHSKIKDISILFIANRVSWHPSDTIMRSGTAFVTSSKEAASSGVQMIQSAPHLEMRCATSFGVSIVVPQDTTVPAEQISCFSSSTCVVQKFMIFMSYNESSKIIYHPERQTKVTLLILCPGIIYLTYKQKHFSYHLKFSEKRYHRESWAKLILLILCTSTVYLL